jgi:hypothetical protein
MAPVFINWLINGYGGDIARTIRHASPPNYAQHTMASKAAIDFKNVDGSPSGDNPEFGMRAEPWHWQYRSS